MFLADTLFALVFFLSLLAFALYPGRGQFRLFFFPALLLGGSFYFLTLSPLILRAPGGRIGHVTAAYAPALKAHGYVEHDWNVSSADAAPGHPVAQDFIDNIAGETEGEATAHTAIILMHSSEGHEETVKALPEIIRLLREKGYVFGVVTPMTPQPW